MVADPRSASLRSAESRSAPPVVLPGSSVQITLAAGLAGLAAMTELRDGLRRRCGGRREEPAPQRELELPSWQRRRPPDRRRQAPQRGNERGDERGGALPNIWQAPAPASRHGS